MDYGSQSLNMTPNTGTPTVGDLSQTVVYSAPVDMRYRRLCAFFATLTGTPSGSLQLMGNVLPLASQSATPASDPSWMPIGASVPVSASGVQVIDLVDTGCLYLMLVYTRTSGTGTITVNTGNKG